MVTYLEEPYFFNEWYGFLYYRNDSANTFVMEKNLAGCHGLKVVNHKVSGSSSSSKITVAEKIILAPGEHKIYILKRTLEQNKFIPLGKVLPSPDSKK